MAGGSMSEARDKVEQALKEGKYVYYHVWVFYETGYSCGEGCCDDSGNTLEDTMDTIERFCGGDWEDVKIDD
jgi:hypothetical protein